MTIDKLLEQFNEKSYEELVEIAEGALTSLYVELEKISDSVQIVPHVIIGYLAASVAADGKLTNKEMQFLKDVLGVDNEKANVILSLGKDPQQVATLDLLFDMGSQEFREIALLFCLSLISIDKEVNRREKDFIERLVN